MRVIYMAHPLGGDVLGNLARAKEWYRWCYSLGLDAVFLTPWIMETEILRLDDGDPVVRSAALDRGIAVVRRCDEVWLVGPHVSKGMQIEANAAKEAGIKIRDFTGYRLSRTEDDAIARGLRREWAGR